ncbi:hypothetical protein IRZ83_07615 [Flavobacterium sp. JLP]|uniref:hypothetical protein n=1 Tax=unclassified Flavobacterium TaxID=196869 RepID=UPI000A44CEE1|nr:MULTISPECIES: hypothetical protein [unclassified Flavobacterium]MBF4492189.1 hypothetical protein [Flavobacterium sp. MR2016-29]MBF4506534.1 hypothetical protein [Flavobacterium sp. JLP]
MKNLKNLKGVKVLTKKQQKAISGGWVPGPGESCPNGFCQFVENGPCRRESDLCI